MIVVKDISFAYDGDKLILKDIGMTVESGEFVCLLGQSWCGFVFMVVVLVIVMQIFERVKNRMLKWTIN